VAATAQAIATYGVVDVAVLDVKTTTARGGCDMWVGASGAKAEVATVDEVTVRRQRYGLTGTVSRCTPECRQWRLSSRAGYHLEWHTWVRHAAQTCRVTVSADTGMREGSGGGARGSAGFRAGWLRERALHTDA
jgi:hypothetical protein